VGARIGVSLLLAAAITFGLLFLMQTLIATGDAKLKEERAGKILDFVRVKRNEIVEAKKDKPKKPPAPDEPPPDIPEPQFDNANPNVDTISVPSVAVSGDINISPKFGFSGSDGEYLPIVKVAPVYPRRAQSRGVEGYVVVEFTVTKAGTVVNPRVIEAEPPNIFDRAALQAVVKFKYKPRVVDGQPIDVPGVQNIIRFQLEG